MTFTEFPIETADLATLPLDELPSDLQKSLGANFALFCDHTFHQHVNHGPFWDPTKQYGLFFWEAWVMPLGGAEYIISDDYGGAHNLLWGCSGGDPDLTITGNVWINGGAVSFGSLDNLYINEWHHVAVGWDGTNIHTWIDGVLSQSTPASGSRNTNGVGIGGICFVGGSSHSNWNGWIRSVRGFEGVGPKQLIGFAQAYRPEHNFRNTVRDATASTPISASFLADYSCPQGTIADLSDGLSNGINQVVSQTVVAASGVTGNGNAKSVVTANGMTNSPKTVTIPVTTSLTTAAQIAQKFKDAFVADADVSRFFIPQASGAVVKLIAIHPQANDSTMNFTVEHDTSTGITDSPTATNSTAGYQGHLAKHPGYMASELDGDNTGSFEGNPPSGMISNIASLVLKPFSRPVTFQGTVNSIPGGAVVYDDFSRPNVTYAWDDSLSPGTARTGQAWTATRVGIIDGCAWGVGAIGGTSSKATILHGSATQDVTMTRKTNSDENVSLIARYTDDSNYLIVQVSSNFIHGYQVIAGSTTAMSGTGQGSSIGTSWSSIRIVASGSSVKVYLDGSGSTTMDLTTSLLTGTKIGMEFGSPFARVETILAT